VRSSECETGVGNLPAGNRVRISSTRKRTDKTGLTLGETGAEQTGDLLDQGVGSDEGVVLASQLLDELLVFVELLQVVGAHGVDTAVLGTIDVVLVTEDADAHVRAGDGREADGARETLVTLGVIVLEADLELDRLEEVALLGLVAVLEEISNVLTHTGCEGINQYTVNSMETDGWGTHRR